MLHRHGRAVKKRPQGCGGGPREEGARGTELRTTQVGRIRVGRGRGCEGPRVGQVGEQGLHGAGILHGSDDPQPAATARAGQAIEIEQSRTGVVAQKPTH